MTLLPQTGYTPLTNPIACEICGKQVSVGDAHSIKVVYAMPGGDFSAFQCANEQHFACSHEHSVLAVVGCLLEHIEQGDYVGKGDEPQNINYINLKNIEQSYIAEEQPQP